MRNVSGKNFEKLTTQISSTPPLEKYCRARQITDDSMEHAHFMLDKCG